MPSLRKRTYARTHARTHARARAHTHTHMHKCARARTHTHARTCTYTHARYQVNKLNDACADQPSFRNLSGVASVSFPNSRPPSLPLPIPAAAAPPPSHPPPPLPSRPSPPLTLMLAFWPDNGAWPTANESPQYNGAWPKESKSCPGQIVLELSRRSTLTLAHTSLVHTSSPTSCPTLNLSPAD